MRLSLPPGARKPGRRVASRGVAWRRVAALPSAKRRGHSAGTPFRREDLLLAQAALVVLRPRGPRAARGRGREVHSGTLMAAHPPRTPRRRSHSADELLSSLFLHRNMRLPLRAFSKSFRYLSLKVCAPTSAAAPGSCDCTS